jgi:hypothetical protein
MCFNTNNHALYISYLRDLNITDHIKLRRVRILIEIKISLAGLGICEKEF